MLCITFFLAFLITLNQVSPYESGENSSLTSTVTFLKPKVNAMRRLNPLKVLFTVAHVPNRQPEYSVEWNLDVLKTMLLESNFVSDEDKALFIRKFSNHLNDYADWSAEKHYELERFTEKYFNLYKSPDKFLPFLDCRALSYALMDEMINDAQPNIDEKLRAGIRASAAERLCDVE